DRRLLRIVVRDRPRRHDRRAGTRPSHGTGPALHPRSRRGDSGTDGPAARPRPQAGCAAPAGRSDRPDRRRPRAGRMSAVDYPDLTSASAGSLADVLPRARADMAPVLDRARTRPHPAAPGNQGTEPADATHFLAGLAVPAPEIAVPAPVPADRPPHLLGVLDLLDAFARRTLTPSGLLTHLRRRWTDDALTGGAVLAVVDGADEAAAVSDLRWREGVPRPLEGIPFAVKDIIDVAATPVTAGSRTTRDRVADTDATVVARLRAAGAIPVLMTATTEFACGAPNNARYGMVTNPWARDRWTGGSSTGSAAALAAGLVPLALGSDTGGSIRVPSAFCNLTGIKPTYGLVPRTGVASLRSEERRGGE